MASLREKLSKIQMEIKAPKNLRNTFGGYNYRNAESILEAFKPFEEKYKVGLIVTDKIEMIADRIYVVAQASLYDCESDDVMMAQAYAREAVTKKGMDDAQVTGATSSYARKYALNGLFLLDDTKDADTDEYQRESDAKANKQAKGKAKEAPAPAPGTEDQKTVVIDAKSVELLRGMFAQNGIDEAFVCGLYKIAGLENATRNQYSNMMGHMEEIKKKQEEKKG